VSSANNIDLNFDTYAISFTQSKKSKGARVELHSVAHHML